MKLYLSPKASYQYQTLKGKSLSYAQQVKVILQDIKVHPLEGIGTPQRVDYAPDGYWERRYNGSGIIYYFYENDCAVVISIVNELLPSHEELPAKLQAMSKEDYAQAIRLMEEDRFVVAVGKWLEEYPEAKALILEEFDLPPEKTTFEYAFHWDIGQRWM